MAGPGICVLCLADTCISEVDPVFNPVAPYGYLLPNMYLFIADIANPDRLFDVVGHGLVSISSAFVRSSASLSAWPACHQNGKSGPNCWQFVTAVTAPPLVCCVVWSRGRMFFCCIHHRPRLLFSSLYNLLFNMTFWMTLHNFLSLVVL